MNNDELREGILHCTKCSLQEYEHVAGRGSLDPDILFVGEAPGQREADLGQPFIGAAGSYLSLVISELKIPEDKYYITNAVKCHPPRNKTPSMEHIHPCREWLLEEIKLLQPKLLVTMGQTATQSILELPQLKISEYRGQFYEFTKKIQVMVTFHPAAVLYEPTRKILFKQDFKKVREYAKKEFGW